VHIEERERGGGSVLEQQGLSIKILAKPNRMVVKKREKGKRGRGVAQSDLQIFTLDYCA